MLTAGKAIEHGEWKYQVKVLEVCCNLETAPLNKRLLSELKLSAANEGQSTSAWNSIYNNFSLFTRNPSIVHLLTFDQNVGGIGKSFPDFPEEEVKYSWETYPLDLGPRSEIIDLDLDPRS